MTMFLKNGANYALDNGIGNAQIKSEISSFGQSLAKAWEKLTDLSAAVLIHYVSQEQVKVHQKKGDTSLVSQLADVLSDNNHAMYVAFGKACESIAGLKLALKQDSEEGEIYVAVDLTKKTRGDVLSGFDEAMDKMLAKGIKESFAKKRKASGTKSSNDKTEDQKAGAVSSVSVATKVAEDTGIAAILNEADDDKTAKLAEVQDLIAAILDHAMNNSNRQQVKDILGSAVAKLNKGFTLSSAMKAVA